MINNTYNFYYPSKNVNQIKVLINDEDYKMYKSIEDEDEAKDFLKSITNGMEWFIKDSPYGLAIEIGKIGKIKCIVTKN